MTLKKRIISIAAFIGNVAIMYNIIKYGLCKETTYKSIVILCIFGLVWCFANIVEIVHSKKKSSESEWRAISEDATDMMGEAKDDGSCFITVPLMSRVTNTVISASVIDTKYIKVFNNTIYVVDDSNNLIMVVYDAINALSDKDKKILEELRVKISELNNVSNITIDTSEGDGNA